MYKTIQTLAILLLFPAAFFAQGKNDYQWVTGYGTYAPNFGGTTIDFNTPEPTYTHFPLPYHFGFDMPCSISDDAGNLQFYSNGCQIINADNELMENGDDLSPGYFQSIECDNAPYGYDSYQNMMILPRPGHPGRYVYFHHTMEMDISSTKIIYTEVDMNANNGKGKVIQKNQLLRGPYPFEGAFTSVKHANGRDWWIIIPEEYVNVYNLYLMTPDTITGPFTQNWEDNETALHPKTGWNIVISPDGTKFVRTTLTWVDGVNRFNRIYLYDFDRCTGSLSNPQVIKMNDPNVFASWAAISPNSRFMYFQIAQEKLFQFDLHAQDIAASAQLIAEYDGFVTPQGFSGAFHAMALAPNNKIYMCCTSGIQYYHTIHKPDELGAACDFRQHDMTLPTVNNSQMPNFPNFRLGPSDNSFCDTLGFNNLPVANFQWETIDSLSPLEIGFTDLSYFEPATWLWDFGDGNTSQDTSPVHIYQTPDTYQVCLTVCNTNDCNTACKEVEINTLSSIITQDDDRKIVLSPNPASDNLHILLDKSFLGDVVITDLAGQRIRMISFNQAVTKMDIPVAELANGVYIISFSKTSETNTSSAKFVVLR
jgi:hypothetical protein